MHAFIKAELWNAIEHTVTEGNMYHISNFFTKEATGKFRPVHSVFQIIFSPATVVEGFDGDERMIPRHKFEIVQLPNILDMLENQNGDQTFAIGKHFVQCSIL